MSKQNRIVKSKTKMDNKKDRQMDWFQVWPTAE